MRHRLAGALAVALALTFAMRTVAEEPTPSPAPPAAVPAGELVPVKLDGKVVFSIRNALGPFSVTERAAAAEKRLRRLAEDPFYSGDLFAVQHDTDATHVLYGHSVVGFVTDQDAAGQGGTREEVAAAWVAQVKTAIAEYRLKRHTQVTRGGWLALGVTVVGFAVFVIGLGWAHRRLEQRIERLEASILPRALQKYIAIPPDRVAATQRSGLKLVRLLVTVVGALVCLQVAFTILPATRGYALTILDYVTEPLKKLWHGFLGSIADLFAAAVLILLVFYVLKGMRWIFTAVADGTIEVPGIAREWALPMYKLLRIVVVGLAVVMVFPYIPGSDTQAFRGVSLFAGALFTLGASGTVGNFIGGLVTMFVGAFRLGDVVKIGDVTGVVIETTLVLTRIRTHKREIVTVPNAAILSAQVQNFSAEARGDGLILHTAVTIGYDAPWRTVHRLLLEAASRTPQLEKAPPPFVLQTALNDFYITYEINAHTHAPLEMPQIYSALHQNIQDAFNEAGVEIMSPHFAALRDGNTIAIPEDRRKGPETRKFEARVENTGP